MSEAILQALADRQAITDGLYRYCRAVDRIDEALGCLVFHADATTDYGAEVYQGSGHGAIAWICAQHRMATTHSHQVTNILIDLDGDRAGSEAYFVSTLRTAIDGRLMAFTTWGRYLDRWSRRDGRWGIEHRLAIRDLDTMVKASPASLLDRGRRDRDDPSYGILGAGRN